MDENQGLFEIGDPTLTEENIFMTGSTETYHTCYSCCKTFRLHSGLMKHMKTHVKLVSSEIKVEPSVSTQTEIKVEPVESPQIKSDISAPSVSTQTEIKVEPVESPQIKSDISACHSTSMSMWMKRSEEDQCEVKTEDDQAMNINVEPECQPASNFEEFPKPSAELHQVDLPLQKCPVCEVIINCWSKETLADHMERHSSSQSIKRKHEKGEFEITVTGVSYVASIDSADEVRSCSKKSKSTFSLECSLCRFYAPSKRQLEFHLKSHPKCTKCRVSFMDQQLLKEHNVKEEHWKCRTCDLVLEDCKSLMKHFKVHRRCSVCKSSFIGPTELDCHLKNHPQCPICNLRWRCVDANFLKLHMLQCRQKHSSKYQCDQCHLDINDPKFFMEHRKTHPQCSICLLRFKEKKELECHMKTHCVGCKVTFDDKQSLNEHMNLNTDCGLCFSSFLCQTRLHDHIKTNHQCIMCKNLFENEKALDEHITKTGPH